MGAVGFAGGAESDKLMSVQMDMMQTNPGQNNEQVVCVENIGPAQRRKRVRFGFVMLAVSAAIAAALLFFGASRWWRLGLFFPLATSVIGFFQAYEKT